MTPAQLAAVMDATWPAATYHRAGPWTIRTGAGGGKRVSAASLDAPSVSADFPADISMAENAMRDLNQTPLFLVRADQAALDADLAARGYQIVDPVLAYAIPVATVRAGADHHSYAHWPPLAIAADIWAKAGIGPARLDVMARAATKAVILTRQNDRAAGVCFVAVTDKTAMLHALEVAAPFRRQGSAQNLVIQSARWAQGQGADMLTLVVTTANVPARALYEKLGMNVVGQYHYRQVV